MGEKLLLVSAGALIGVFFAFISNSYFNIKNQQIAHISDYLSDLKLLEDAAIEYWLNSSESDWEAQQQRSAVLKGHLSATNAFIDRAQKLLSSKHSRVSDLDEELYFAATDGSFETRSQKPNLQKVELIMDICAQLRYELRDLRWRLFWAH